jgi:hypothetical protein
MRFASFKQLTLIQHTKCEDIFANNFANFFFIATTECSNQYKVKNEGYGSQKISALQFTADSCMSDLEFSINIF